MTKLISCLFLVFWAFGLYGEEPPTPPPNPELETSRFMGEFFKMLLVLGAMVAVLLFVSWYLKRLTGAKYERINDASLIKVVEKRALAPRTNVYILDVEGHTIVMGETPHGLVRLAEYSSKE